MKTLPILISCPQRRYQYSGDVTAVADINPVVAHCIHKYRREAYDEHVRLHSWMLERLDDQVCQNRLMYPEWDRFTCHTKAREHLLGQGTRMLDLYPIGKHVSLSIGIDSGASLYFVDVENVELPFASLSGSRCGKIWHRMQELRETFEGLDIKI